jgi:F0F1-type ATP synthase membrane subunit b/b'
MKFLVLVLFVILIGIFGFGALNDIKATRDRKTSDRLENKIRELEARMEKLEEDRRDLMEQHDRD